MTETPQDTPDVEGAPVVDPDAVEAPAYDEHPDDEGPEPTQDTLDDLMLAHAAPGTDDAPVAAGQEA